MWGGWNTRPQRKSEKHTCLVLYNGVNLGLHMKARSCQVVTQTTPVRTVLQRGPLGGRILVRITEPSFAALLVECLLKFPLLLATAFSI